MDEIISEVRKTRDEIVREHRQDLHALCEFLRRKERLHKDRVADLRKRKQVERQAPKSDKI